MPLSKQTIWKSIRWLFAVIAIVLTAIILSVYFWGNSFSRQQLADILKKKTNGQYTVSFSEISVNPIKRNLSITDLSIRSTSKDTTDHKFEFSTKTINFESISLLDYFNKNELHIKRIKIEDPFFQISNNPNQNISDENIDELVQALRPFINQYFTSISVNEIVLLHAGLLSKKPSRNLISTKSAINFNIGVIDFYTDSTILATQDYFKAKDIFLGIANYQKLLSDSIHLLQVEKLNFSIKNKGINAVNVNLHPSDSSSNDRTLYWVDFPELYIKSRNINEIFQEDTIQIDTLELKSAQIRVRPPTNAPGVNFKEMKEFDLYQLVKNEFTQLNIGLLKLNADKLQIERKKDKTSNKQIFEELVVELNQFQLDSLSYSNSEKILYSDQININVDQYSIELNDHVHKFSANQIIANSKTNTLSADHLKMWANDSQSKITKVSLNCDSIRMHNVDMTRLYHHREMPLQEIAAYKPIIDIDRGKNKRKTRSNESNSLLYNFISNYIKGIYSNLITIENGQFKVATLENKQDSSVIEANFSFRLTDFSLDSISANKTDKLFFATNIELEFDDYHMKLQDQLHILNMDRIEVSSIQKRASIKNLHLFPIANEDGLQLLKERDRTGLYDIQIPLLQLRNTNIHHAFFNKRLNINYFSIIEPKIQFELRARNKKNREEFDLNDFYNLIKTYIRDIQIGQLKIPNGQFQLVNHDRKGRTISFDNKFNLELEGFRFNDDELDNNRLLFSDQFELTLKDHLFKLSDNVHYLQLKEIGFSTKRNEVRVKNAILYPDITSRTYAKSPRHLQINIPDFTLEGVDIKNAYFSKELVVKKLNINSPNIKIYQTGNTKSKLYLKDFTIPLPEEIKLLSLDELNLNNGHLSLLKTNNKLNREISSLDIDLTGTHVSLKSNGKNQPAKLTSSTINSTLRNLTLIPDLGNYNFNIGQVKFSQNKSQIQVQDFMVSLKDGIPQNGFTGTTIKRMDIEGLEINENNRRDIIHSNSIVAEGAVFNFTKREQTKNSANLYELKLNDDLLTLMDEFSSNSIHLKDAVLNINDEALNRNIKNINLDLTQFKINALPSGKLLGAEKLELSLSKLNGTDKNDWYDLSCNEFKYTSSPSTISFMGIKVKPKYSKHEFQQIIPFQTDHYNGEIGLIQFTDFDLQRYLDKKELAGNQIRFENARFDIYRDMRKPFNEKQRPPMPQDIIGDYKLPFYFDSVKIVSSAISYSEQLDEIPDPGTIHFQNLNACLYPFTNISSRLNQNPIVNLRASTELFGKIKLNSEIQFDQLSPENYFIVKGQLSPFDMSVLNPMTRNAALITIRSGQLNRFEFDFHANNTHSNGKLKFAYDDLKVNILSIKDGDTKESKFASFLANSLMIKSKNPRSKILLPDQIYYERDEKRSILNYWWKSVFSGVKNTFGIKEEDK
ncbi:hypothetical protein ACUNWD_15870 [Sunxiuqinia sp. A32]|uniref:hypothetical protein n=1 Tax=Sunxiuqinia sp. A32 TaxID=3461496 RepID=UPI004045FA8D